MNQTTRQHLLGKTKHQKEERLECNEVVMVEEAKRPGYTLSALQKEHVRRREEAELCRLPAVGDKDDPESRASYPESAGGRRKTLYNNWVGEEKTESEPVKGNIGTNSSTHLLFAAKDHRSEEKTQTTKPNMLQRMQDKLKIRHWVKRYISPSEGEKQ